MPWPEAAYPTELQLEAEIPMGRKHPDIPLCKLGVCDDLFIDHLPTHTAGPLQHIEVRKIMCIDNYLSCRKLLLDMDPFQDKKYCRGLVPPG
jgi:hypothetical protein